MGEKKIIDKAEVERVQESNTAGFYAAVGIILLGAILAIIFIPLPGNLIGFLFFLVIAYFMLKARSKTGMLKVYFSQKPLAFKTYKHVPGEDDDTEAPYFEFDGRECKVTDEKYNKANVGDLFYVMYNVRNDQIVDCYSADEYDIDPTLDIR